MQDLTDAFVELIRRAATLLPADMERALRKARGDEEPGSAAEGALDTILKNVEMSRAKSTPICQDTGTPIFTIHYPLGVSTRKLADQIRQACAIATEKGYLRPNAVDSLTGKNSGNNTGIDFPTMHFEEWDEEELKVNLILKGGGCENVSTQYELPNDDLGAGRDLEGVRRVVLDAVHKAQGLGCAPGVLGVAVGGDRGTSYNKSKQLLLRPLDDTNEDSELAELEDRLLEEGNQLGIGPMGFGGKTTLLGVKVGSLHRLPASYFVSVAYMCWANRRASMRVVGEEITYA
ncbi:MAG: fumarate hydratase [Anaerolineae bacterium]|nr:fumarate hydratase [Anaerolineae bacterium]